MAKKSSKKGSKSNEENKEEKRKAILPFDIFSKNLLSQKHILAILLGLVVLAVIINLRYSSETTITTTTTTAENLETTTTTSASSVTTTTAIDSGYQPTGKTRLLVALEEDENKLRGGNELNELTLTFTNIEIYGEDGNWVTLLEEPKTLNLLNYTDTLVEIDTESGKYDKLRLELSDGSILITNTLLDIYRPKRYDLIAPSETVLEYELNLPTGEDTTLILDFDIANSVMREGTNYVMDPIIEITEQKA